MKRTTIMLPEELRMRAQRAAHLSRKSLGDLIRRGLEKVLEEDERKQKEDPFFADKEIWSGPAAKDGAEDHDSYLYKRP